MPTVTGTSVTVGINNNFYLKRCNIAICKHTPKTSSNMFKFSEKIAKVCLPRKVM